MMLFKIVSSNNKQREITQNRLGVNWFGDGMGNLL